MLALAAVGAFMVLRWILPARRRSEFKCESCSHCRKLFLDGVRCGYRDKEVFKNPAQIDMCPDHQRR